MTTETKVVESPDTYQNCILVAMENLPSGTLIIPMDNTLQTSGGKFNVEAYGLAVHLLHAGIPLKWIIKSGKTKDAIDFTANARLNGSATAGTGKNFLAGPIAIHPGFELEAQAIISTFSDVDVYELTQTVMVEVAHNLTHKPYAALLNNGGKAAIHRNVYVEAGLVENTSSDEFVDGTHFKEVDDAASLDCISCYTFASEPHTDESEISTTTVDAIANFLQCGGNFLAQCHAVEAYANSINGSLLATYSSKPGIGGNIIFDNSDEPYAQFEGGLTNQGGSVISFIFTSNPIGGKRVAYDDANGNNFKSYVGKVTGVTASEGGFVHYLAGHEYKDDNNEDVNGKRMLLNALLRPAERPQNCNFSIGITVGDDTGTIGGCGEETTINVNLNDLNPLGGTLTTTLLGAGTNGIFVKNNDGTVTYTANDGDWPGSDMITYEACDGNGNCDQGTITITSTSSTTNSISGQLFLDADQDGTFNNSDVGKNGVMVNLFEDFDIDCTVDGAAIQSKMTDGNGTYTFDNITAVLGATAMIDVRVENDDDDARQKNNGDVETDKDFKIKAGDDTQQAIRFTGISIPMDVMITNAYIEFTAKDDKDDAPSGTTIKGETASEIAAGFVDKDDSGAKDQLSDRLAANGTAASVSWSNIPAWTGGDKYQTPNLTSLVQEIRTTLTGASAAFNGNMVFFFNNDNGAKERKAYDYSKTTDANQRHRLVIEYSVPDQSSYLVKVDPNTIPIDATLTTSNCQSISFTQTGGFDCGENIGYYSATEVPVELVQFTAHNENCKTTLYWETASETDNSHFEVQYATDAKTFKTLAKVTGAGTTVEPQQYNYVHENTGSSNLYYRLKQLDFDGTYEYSELLAITSSCKQEAFIETYPNPLGASQRLKVRLFTEHTAITLEVKDLNGKTLKSLQFNAEKGWNTFNIDVNAFSAGIYFIQSNVGESASFIKID